MILNNDEYDSLQLFMIMKEQDEFDGARVFSKKAQNADVLSTWNISRKSALENSMP
jgi:hypothetical protein